MLVLRDPQLKALEQAALRQRESRLVQEVLDRRPGAAARMSADAVRRQVAAGIRRAEAHGILREADIRGFLRLGFVLGPDFDDADRFPWARVILGWRKENGTVKVAALEREAAKIETIHGGPGADAISREERGS